MYNEKVGTDHSSRQETPFRLVRLPGAKTMIHCFPAHLVRIFVLPLYQVATWKLDYATASFCDKRDCTQQARMCEFRHVKYLKKLIEQDHRFLKLRVKLGRGFFSFERAWRTLQGYALMNILRKRQMRGVTKGERG